MLSKIPVASGKKRELIDITGKVAEVVQKSRVSEGTALVFARHTTCSIVITELEGNLEKDLLNYFEREGPKGPFFHSHGDFAAHEPERAKQSHTPAHLISALYGQQTSVPIENGQLLLGTWQRICLLELDGPRHREIIVQIANEGSRR